MVVTVTYLMDRLYKFFDECPENKPMELWRNVMEEIYDGFMNVKIASTSLNYVSEICILSKVMKIFQNVDVLEPLNNVDFNLFVKLSRLIIEFKIIIVTEPDFIDSISNKLLTSNFTIERYICDNYKSKLEIFKIKYNEEEIETIKNNFTLFLVKFVNLMSILHVSTERYVELLLEVGDLEILVENFHLISNYISKDRKMIILKQITTHCMKTNFNLQNCELIKSSHEQFRLEKCSMSYFILQKICKYLKLQNICQSSKILSLFTIENVISPNSEIQTFYEESIKLITFRTYSESKVIPAHKIIKCLKYLQFLLDSLLNHNGPKCTQFDIVILSILSEFVMATESKLLIIYLMDLIIDHLHIYKLPSNFLAVSYAFKIYQKLKFDNDMKIKSIDLCNSLSMNSGLRIENNQIKYDLERVINNEENWTDKSIIISYFLFNNIKNKHLKNDDLLNNIIYTFNEYVILTSHYTPMNGLLFPFSVSLHFSLINKNKDCLYNNLAILDSYIPILFDTNEIIQLDNRIHFLSVIFHNYNDISEWLPDEFFLKCWKFILDTQNMDINISKKILLFCTSKSLREMIGMLISKTLEIIKRDKLLENDNCFYIVQLWSSLMNMQLVKNKKNIRRDYVNHFCFILNNTLFFSNTNITTQGLILLLKMVGLILKVSWINKNTLMNCSLRIITLVERSSKLEVNLLIEAAELLIVLYKCPNNYIKSYLGLFLITFANLTKKCWSFVKNSINTKTKLQDNTFIPFHKLEKCSSLFKSNKKDFKFICIYIIQELANFISEEGDLPDEYMRHFNNIIFNLIVVCSCDEIRSLLCFIKGPAIEVIGKYYDEYKRSVRFTGRI